MEYWHLTFPSNGRHPLFPDEPMRREAIWAMARVIGGEVVLFCITDDHLHVVIRCGPGRLKGIKIGLFRSLTALAATPVEPAHTRRVETRSHMQWLVKYHIEQVIKHNIDVHPALWSGSCFQDLAGARRVEGLQPRLWETLPRLSLNEVCQMAGLPRGRITPASDEQIRRAGAARLVSAAGEALAVEPQLQGKTKWITQARRAAVQVGAQAGISRDELAWALDMVPRSVGRLSRPSAEEGLLRAVRIRLSLEDMVAGSGGYGGR